MLRSFNAILLSGLLALLGGIGGGELLAQTPAAANGAALRKLAPGVVIEIPPEIEQDETFSGPREFVELLARAPKFNWEPETLAKTETLAAMAKDVVFRRAIWGLEFGFKPIRMIDVAIPQSDGTVVPQRVYYLVYYVKNNGRHLNPAPQDDKRGNVTYAAEEVDHTIRFFPSLMLQAHDVDRVYLDEVIPAAIEPIRLREDPNRTFYNSVTISTVSIPVSTEYEDNSVWGIATWVGVDPRSDFFSVLVQGLTNAYRWQDPPGAVRPDDPPMTGRRFSYKTLQINFWRPGDALETREDEIRFGVPNQNQVASSQSGDEVLKIYRLKERVDYLWVYR